jgi:hypothetical protein
MRFSVRPRRQAVDAFRHRRGICPARDRNEHQRRHRAAAGALSIYSPVSTFEPSAAIEAGSDSRWRPGWLELFGAFRVNQF